MSSRVIRALLFYAHNDDNATLSYQRSWPKHFRAHPGFRCTSMNLADRSVLGRAVNQLKVRAGCFDAIVLLHSVFSNACFLAGRLLEAVEAAPQRKAFFLGNEYKLMLEKMAFCEALGVALLVSQSNSPAVHELYRRRLGARVISLPNTGLDPAIFFPREPWDRRPIDIGYRAFEVPLYLGHDDKRRLAEAFCEAAARHGLRADISMDPRDRFDEAGWADFLNRCKTQLGAEAGSDYFELTDETRLKVNAYTREHPAATFEEIFARFFANYGNPLPARMLASRHIEAAGTKTLQILLEGDYNGYLKPDVHYVPVRKDFANVDEAIEKSRDRAYGERIIENAYELALQEFTYDRLLGRFHRALAELL